MRMVVARPLRANTSVERLSKIPSSFHQENVKLDRVTCDQWSTGRRTATLRDDVADSQFEMTVGEGPIMVLDIPRVQKSAASATELSSRNVRSSIRESMVLRSNSVSLPMKS